MTLRRTIWPLRSTAEWGIRAALAVLAALLGIVAVVHGLAQTLGQPALAPGDGRFTARAALALSGPDATAADRARADRMARTALRQDATALPAVTTLGLNAQLRGDTPAARRFFAYAQVLSRRNLQTQLWAIEDAVHRGSIAEALRHYDIALRTSRDAPALLYPVLATAIADPKIQRGLTSLVPAGAGWVRSFVDYAATRGPDPRSTAQLILRLRAAGMTASPGAVSGTVNALLAGNWIDDAWSFYAAVRPASDRQAGRDPNFDASPGVPSMLDWMPINEGGISSSVQAGMFEFAASAGAGGPMLRQMELLPAGTYRLAGRISAGERPIDPPPYWAMRCADGRPLGRVNVAGATFAGIFAVPMGCPTQMLELMLPASTAISGVVGTVESARLTRVAPR